MTWFQMESEVNDMSPKNDFSDIFDDDFEVTYEEDPEINFHTSEDTEQINRPDSNTETITEITLTIPMTASSKKYFLNMTMIMKMMMQIMRMIIMKTIITLPTEDQIATILIMIHIIIHIMIVTTTDAPPAGNVLVAE